MIAVYILAGIVGLCVGSFLNVVIYRVPNGMSVAMPPSHCPKCGYQLKWYDNVPVLSYLFLGGKCRSCRDGISFRYTAVELLNALLWVGAVWAFWEQSIVYACIVAGVCSVLVCVTFIDIEHQLVFDRFVIMLAVAGVGAIFFDGNTVWWEHLVGLGVATTFFFLVYFAGQWIFKKEALGGGDVKLAMAMGLLLGWKNFLFATLVSTVVASILLLILQKITKAEKGREYPFAPFLVLGCIVALFFGNWAVEAYISLIVGA